MLWLKELYPYVPHRSPQPYHSGEFSSYEAKPPVSESSLCRHIQITVAANVSVLAATSQVIIIKDTLHLKHTLIMFYMDFEAVMGNSHPYMPLLFYCALDKLWWVYAVWPISDWLLQEMAIRKAQINWSESVRQSAVTLSWLTHQTKQSLICVSAIWHSYL